MSSSAHRVREQYELLPYPQRDPSRERATMRICGLDELGAINHYCWNGGMDFDRGFRVLVAGGGTGDATVQLALQLQNTRAELVHIDISDAAIDIARRRIDAWDLGHRVEFRRQSLLDLDTDDYGKFDYINCSGVLHHLQSPEAGLAALTRVLKPRGVLGLLLYGEIGRSAIYQMQRLFAALGMKGQPPSANLLDTARTILNGRPAMNWSYRGRDLFPDGHEYNDAELYDLYLHPLDRAYTCTGIFELLGTSGLRFVEHSYERRHLYRPENTFADPEVLSKVQALPLPQQQEICELYWGNLTKHSFWAARHGDGRVNPSDDNCIPFWSRTAKAQGLDRSIASHRTPVWSCQLPVQGGALIDLRISLSRVLRQCFSLIDGQTSTGAIVTAAAKAQDCEPGDTRRQFCDALAELGQLDCVLLRRSAVPGRGLVLR